MSLIRNIYCDESCHLSFDKSAMALGAITVPASRVYHHNLAIREIKLRNNISEFRELKWIKVSPAQLSVYEELIDYFFQQEELQFRAVIIPDKSKLDHEAFCQSHDDWYYKMYFYLLRELISAKYQNQIYVDIKDTQSKQKVKKLHKVLCCNEYDFNHEIISKVQTIRSHEVQLMSILDILIGALTYRHRNLNTSTAKLRLIEKIMANSGRNLLKSTLPSEGKFNLFVWHPRERRNLDE